MKNATSEHLTGGELARVLVGYYRVAHSLLGDYFDPCDGNVHLTRSTFRGTDSISLLVAAHECRHRHQFMRWPRLFNMRWFLPVTWCLEIGAWLSALRIVYGLRGRSERWALRRYALKNFLSYL